MMPAAPEGFYSRAGLSLLRPVLRYDNRFRERRHDRPQLRQVGNGRRVLYGESAQTVPRVRISRDIQGNGSVHGNIPITSQSIRIWWNYDSSLSSYRRELHLDQ